MLLFLFRYIFIRIFIFILMIVTNCLQFYYNISYHSHLIHHNFTCHFLVCLPAYEYFTFLKANYLHFNSTFNSNTPWIHSEKWPVHNIEFNIIGGEFSSAFAKSVKIHVAALIKGGKTVHAPYLQADSDRDKEIEREVSVYFAYVRTSSVFLYSCSFFLVSSPLTLHLLHYFSSYLPLPKFDLSPLSLCLLHLTSHPFSSFISLHFTSLTSPLLSSPLSLLPLTSHLPHLSSPSPLPSPPAARWSWTS